MASNDLSKSWSEEIREYDEPSRFRHSRTVVGAAIADSRHRQKHGAYNVQIFGSVARGEATEDSDVDFLVDYDLEKITPWFPGGLLIDLELLLNRRVDIATVDMLKERTRDRVLHEAVLQ